MAILNLLHPNAFWCILLRKKENIPKHGRWTSLQHKWITVHKLSHLLHGRNTWILQNAPTNSIAMLILCSVINPIPKDLTFAALLST
jgi:hypothetical protein